MKKYIGLLAVFGLVEFCSTVLAANSVQQDYSGRPDVQVYIDKLVSDHGMKRPELMQMFQRAQRQQAVLDAISKPAERELTWAQYRPIFVTDTRAESGAEFWQVHVDLLNDAERRFGIPPEIIVSIIGVETLYGKSKGNYPVFDSLITLGFDGESRTGFFQKELEAFLLLARDERFNPFSAKGSYAGAMGIPQFISSSYREYAVDFNEDGRRNLFNDPADAIGSVANYFKRHGWKAGDPVTLPVKLLKKEAVTHAVGRGRGGLKPELTVAELRRAGVKMSKRISAEEKAVLIELEGDHGKEYWMGLKNFYVITRYNSSSMYAMAVYQLSQKIKQRYDSLEKTTRQQVSK